ncbi:hypothetical protein [Vitiosangium sp. GDMCC 1.1324]|uniref:hypothetical protein n=1 Tax=Vitiosangium sp. (strain GDMCC 1.1324) TaxID=2138576 RepID=UPI000D3AE8FF|nr:hypothetical protein [Vitiosangium sp. GDMCC 1.1324]PTL78649.1 hypothetical protein DAT35_36860 [Vitiosangium sp. GDMCC 1.1324]
MTLAPAAALGLLVSVVPSQQEKPLLVVTPPEARDAVLLDEEAAKLHDAAAAFLAQQKVGAELVPPTEIRALAVLAASGRTADDGPVCARPPSLEELISRRYPGAGRAYVSATSACKPSPVSTSADAVDTDDPMARLERDKSCERMHMLEVGGRIPGAEGQQDRWLHWRATVAHPETGQGWIEAIRHLRKLPQSPMGYSILGLDKGQGVELEYSVLLGPWRKGGPFFSRAPSGSAAAVALREGLAAAEERVQTCHVESYGRSSVGLQLDREGKVAACVSASDERARPAHHHCLCDAFAQATFPPGAKGRRLFVALVNHYPPRGEPRPERGSQFSPPTENTVWVNELPKESSQEVSAAAAACVKGKPLSASFEAPITLALAPDGTVNEAAFNLPPGLEETRECLVQALRKARYVCPEEGSGSAKAGLSLRPPPAKK